MTVRECGGRGGLNRKAKAQVFTIMPLPLFFLEVGRKKGGGNGGTYVQDIKNLIMKTKKHTIVLSYLNISVITGIN